jgi:hypothetical protein
MVLITTDGLAVPMGARGRCGDGNPNEGNA